MTQQKFTQEEKAVMNDYKSRYIKELNGRDIVAELGLRHGKADSKGGNRYICPLCHNGEGPDGTGSIKVKGNKIKCYSASVCFGERYQDVLGALCLMWRCKPDEALKRRFPGFSYGEALKEARQGRELSVSPLEAAPITPPPIGGQSDTAPGTAPEPEKLKPVSQAAFYSSCERASAVPAAAAYFAGRGFNAELMDKYNFLYWREGKRVVIPFSETFYLARLMFDAKIAKYTQPQGLDTPLYNIEALQQSDEPVFLVEGALDAISIIESGGQAISLNGARNTAKLTDKLSEMVENGEPVPPLFLMLDPDNGGQTGTNTLIKTLDELSLSYQYSQIIGSYHDANARFAADREGLAAAIRAETRKFTRPDNSQDYLTGGFLTEIQQFSKRGSIPTGFKNYDTRYKGIYAGVYIMAAVTSLGKTTFIHQLGENLATQGNHVIYFSTEQSRLELVSKSISRRSTRGGLSQGIINIDIREGRCSADRLQALIDSYIHDVGDRYSIVYSGINGLTPAYVREYTERYIEANHVKPIVIIDYLQVMQPDDTRLYTDRKRALDDSFHKLIALSKEYTLTVFIISSINRSNYLAPIDFESFKESGELEFGADVVLGLQLECMNEDIFTSSKGTIEKRNQVKKAKTEIPRHVELVTLKDRFNGLRDTDGGVYLDYYPQYDLFVDGHKHNEHRPKNRSTHENESIETLYEFDDNEERL